MTTRVRTTRSLKVLLPKQLKQKYVVREKNNLKSVLAGIATD